MVTGTDNVFTISLAMSAANWSCSIFGNIRINSSPAKRANISSLRKHFFNRLLTSINNKSPPSCPNESFTNLNPSRSINSKANSSFCCVDVEIILFKCSLNNTRLGKLVRGSWYASILICACCALSSEISL